MNLKGAIKELVVLDENNDVIIKETYDYQGVITSFLEGRKINIVSSIKYDSIDLNTRLISTGKGCVTSYLSNCAIRNYNVISYYDRGQLFLSEYVDDFEPSNNQYSEYEYGEHGELIKRKTYGDRSLIPYIISFNQRNTHRGYLGQTDTYSYCDGELIKHHSVSILGESQRHFEYDRFDRSGNWQRMCVISPDKPGFKYYTRTLIYY